MSLEGANLLPAYPGKRDLNNTNTPSLMRLGVWKIYHHMLVQFLS